MAKCRYSYLSDSGNCMQDNYSQTAIIEVPILNCEDKTEFPTDCNELFNSNICRQDAEYYSPICQQYGKFGDKDGQFIYFQLRFFVPEPYRSYGWKRDADQENWYIKAEILTACCEEIEEFDVYPAIAAANTFHIDALHYQNIAIDITTLPDYFMIRFTTADGKIALIQPFKKDCCNPYVTLEGVNESYDCQGRYYSLPELIDSGDTYLKYRAFARFYCQPFLSSFGIVETVNKNVRLSITKSEKLQIRSGKVPYYIANDVANILASAKILVSYVGYDKLDYIFAGEINKNLDSSEMWELDFSLSRTDCSNNLKCQ